MAQIFTLLIILSLFFAATNGKVDCVSTSDCPRTLCVYPWVVWCINYICDCHYSKPYTKGNRGRKGTRVYEIGPLKNQI
ncbi:hypothetical protein P8452_19366 [Trifolium repens]|nr:hypothetical protein P8452_19366 [Trifolium repens]